MNDKAIELLVNRPKGSEYYPFHYLDYLTGLAKLHRLDKDASDYFVKYLNNFKGTNYIKDAYQKIAWHYFIHGNSKKYSENMLKVLEYGTALVDADEQAERAAENGEVPNYHLLRGRLLFDGGYYPEALTELTYSTKNFLENERDSLEFYYRIGRIYHEWGKEEASITFYEKTIQEGAESEYYFAANSALKLGNIYEGKGDYKKAKYFYERAQSMNNKEYRNSISSKAKAGINRIENN
jgi:tetratricopeptide (TPR) repeat protein